MSEADDVKCDELLELPLAPVEFFKYCGSAAKAGNSLYRCLKCPTGTTTGGKKISCSDKSRLNLKKHIQVRCLP